MIRAFLLFLALTLFLFPIDAAAKPSVEDQVKSALIDAVRQRAGYSDATVLTVRTLRPSDTALFREAKSFLSLVLPPGESGTGTITAQVKVKPGGSHRSSDMLWVMARVTVQVPTLVTTRAIPRGTFLNEDDVKIELREKRRNTVAMEEIVGRIARRGLRAGEVLKRNLLTSPQLVKRGQIVNATVSGRAFRIKTKAECLSRGGLGDTIRAKVLNTGKIVTVQIQSSNQVELLL